MTYDDENGNEWKEARLRRECVEKRIQIFRGHLISAANAARIMNVTRSTIYNWLWRKEVTRHKLKARTFVSIVELATLED